MLRDHGKTALIHGGREISFSELIENCKSMASLIDILPEDRVIIFSENRPEWIYTLYGTWQRGGIAVPVDFMSSPGEVSFILKDSEPKILFCSNQTKERAEEAIKLAGTEIEVINFDETALPKPFDKTFRREPDDTALIIYTSGTTGDPKGVMLTFKNLRSNIDAIAEAGIVEPRDSTLAILPFHHAYPLMTTILVPLTVGASIVFLDRLTPEDILEKLQRYRITILVGVPRLYSLFHRKIMDRINESLPARLLFKLMKKVPSKNLRRKVFAKVHETFGGNIKYFVSGGAKLDPQIAMDFMTLGFTVLEGYGLTETSPIVTFNPPHDIRIGSVGIPVKDVFVRISGDGEVLVRGPNVMKGYWRRERDTQEVIRFGWLHTGDLGYTDSDGYLYITGRRKELIVLGTGKNVFPEEIENMILHESELVKEAGVFEMNGKLYAILHPDMDKVREKGIVNLQETLKWEVIDRVNRKLPEWKRISGVRVSEKELPKTRLGKLKRFLLPELYTVEAPERKEKEDISVLETEEGALIAAYLEKETKVKVFPSHHLEIDLGLDSLGKVEFLSFLEKSFGVKLTEDDLSANPTVKDIIHLVRERKFRVGSAQVSWKTILQEAQPTELPDHRTLFRVGRLLLRGFFKIYNRAEIEGTENLPEKPFILAPNHASYLDAFVLGSLLPEEVAKDTYFLGEETYFSNPITSLFGRVAHVITVNINKKLKESLQKTAWALRLGKVVVIFPEGARTRDGKLMEFKKGVAILSKELEVPVVPVAIKGTYRAMSIYDRFPKPTKIKVKIGSPIYPNGLDYDSIVKKLQNQVEKLLK
jgi:long-chain acyl-CoA synthetase